jgi:hypothetical protein
MGSGAVPAGFGASSRAIRIAEVPQTRAIRIVSVGRAGRGDRRWRPGGDAKSRAAALTWGRVAIVRGRAPLAHSRARVDAAGMYGMVRNFGATREAALVARPNDSSAPEIRHVVPGQIWLQQLFSGPPKENRCSRGSPPSENRTTTEHSPLALGTT